MPLIVSDRERDAQRKRESRAPGKEVKLVPPFDLVRRRACLADPFEFMRTYFKWIFSQPFVSSRKAMAESLIHAARYGGDYAVAGARGSGKSGIALFTTFWLDLRQETVLPLIIGKNQRGSEVELSNLKQAITESPDFTDDFPEVCLPIIALDDWASAARKQTVGGYRTKIGWEKDCVFLPTVEQIALPGKWPDSEPSVACGQGIAVVGVDGKIRGFKRRNIRPRLAIFDDIDDRESARSESQTNDHRQAIDQDAIGLAGSGERTSRVMLCTTINNTCAAAIYTSMASWRGQRFRAISKMPEREDLREQYISLRKSRDKDDPDARKAHRLYLDNKLEIERGGEVDNPYDFVSRLGEDGDPLEVSALQHYFNLIADGNERGWNAFLCEWQNDPPPEDELNPDEITSNLVGRRISGLEHGVPPPDCLKVVSFVDIGERNFNWTDTAWSEGCVGSVLDYGITDVNAGEFNRTTGKRDPKTLELAIMAALHDWRTALLEKYRTADGEPIPISLALIDSGSGLHYKAVYRFCREVGAPFFPSKGMKETWKVPTDASKRGDRWALVKQEDKDPTINGMRVYYFDSTYWKKFCHQRFLTETNNDKNTRATGSLAMFILPEDSQSARDRNEYTHQICGVTWGVKRPGGVPCWVVHGSGKDHFLDATAGCCLGGNIVGIRLVGDVKKPAAKPLNLAALAAAAKRE